MESRTRRAALFIEPFRLKGMENMIDGKIEWKTDPAKTIAGLKMSLQKRGIARAIKASLPPVVAAVTANASAIEDTGTLAKSIGMRVKTYRNSVVGIVGPKSKFQKTFGTISRGEHRGQPRVKRPAWYAPRVEKGTRRSKARDFLKSALQTTQQPYLESVTSKIGEEINKELAKVK